MDEIIPGLWIGDLACALAKDYLDLAGVTHIIRALKQNIDNPGTLPSGRSILADNIKSVRVDDVDSSPILVHFSAMNELIDNALQEVWCEDDGPGEAREQDAEGRWGHWETTGEGTVLVHCQAGMSRSVTLVAAYLMWRRNLRPEDALKIIRDRRAAADPNSGFKAQLDLYHQCDYQVDLRHKAVRRFLMSKTNILDGDSIDDVLLSYYPSPYPSPGGPKHGVNTSPSSAFKLSALPIRGPQEGGAERDGEAATASTSSQSGSSNTTPSSSVVLSSSTLSTTTANAGRRRRTFSSTSWSGEGGRPPINLSISPSLPDSMESLEESDFSKAPQSAPKPEDYPSSSLSQPPSMEVKVTEGQGRLPGGVSSIRGNETPRNRGQLSQPLYSGPKLRCKMCRRELASLQDHLIDHEPGKGQMAFEHKKRNAPGGAQASADSRTGFSAAVLPKSPTPTPATSASSANTQNTLSVSGRPIQTAASLSASLPPHLAALRLGRAPPTASQPPQPKAAPSPAANLQLDLSTIPPVTQTTPDGKDQVMHDGHVNTAPLPGAGVPAPLPSPSTVTLPSKACSSYFVEPLQWMSALKEGEIAGRLDCPAPRCGAKLGSWDWAGMQCGCGAWITPAFALHRSKVDIVL